MQLPQKRRDGTFDFPDLSTLPPDGGKEFNRLVFTSSPYLLQHARNPVDWYPWGDEAFARARSEDKPVFLSIGYSTCHWCHVMEHESFENPAVAEFLAEHFISIKVDREERPDIDDIYMTVCQAMTGSGGWPLTVFLTPDRKPFYAGTYFPPDDRFGRPGFMRVLSALREAWIEDRNKITGIAEELQTQLAAALRASEDEIPEDILERAVDGFRSNYDSVYGGFGAAPKFPMGHTLRFLLRRAADTRDDELRTMVEHTLLRMYRGGLWDHLGGGFCRYSTDRKWLVPHFEKMLYDNALLLDAYVDAYQLTRKDIYRTIAEELITYVRRDMTDERGMFYSAENADTEGVEGKFYVFTREEFDDIVGSDATMLAEYFGVEAAGNFEQGQNILHIAVDHEEWCRRHDLSSAEGAARVAAAKRALFQERALRVHPSLDDKILTSWNGLMVSALARAGSVFADEAITGMAVRAATSLTERMLRSDGTLLRRLRGNEAGIPGFLEDYAFLMQGMLELYDATFETHWLQQALAIADAMLLRFSDSDSGGLYFTAGDAEQLLVRSMEAQDGALPSGNSVAALTLLRLGRMTGRNDLSRRGESIVHAFGTQVQRAPTGSTVLLMAWDFARNPGREIVIAAASEEAASALRSELRRHYLPRSVVLLHTPANSLALTGISPFTANNTAVDGKPTAWVCRDFACEMPVHTPGEMAMLLAR
ncbi:MAG: thioredoxin domain-containing protein [Bacteroidota bacterium]|nr:thioredoxin domain-containing protein [Bacteroidota bacterium]